MQPTLSVAPPPPGRADITDRNGTILAVSLPGAALYADPQQVPDPARRASCWPMPCRALMPHAMALKLGDGVPVQKRKEFVYLDRKLTPQEELAVNSLGIPGVYFENNEKRHYPDGDLAAHILGGVKVDCHRRCRRRAIFQQAPDQSIPTPLALVHRCRDSEHCA